MKLNHNYFSNLAFQLAENHLGKTKTNPSVGCLIVKDNCVISSGITSINGRPHAEFNALNKKYNFKNCQMYVTLEPCSHYGLTPPCTNIIKKKGINKVFYCFDDPDERSYKKAKKKLKKNNIILKKLNYKSNFYESYFINKRKNLPFVDAKIAFSKDFYTISKKYKWITNERSRKVGHLLRSKYDTILSTSKSINQDNSLLNCRIKGLSNNKPDLIIIDRKLKLKKNLKLFNIVKKRSTYIFTTSNNKKKINYFKKKGIKIIQINRLDKKKDFINLFKNIFDNSKRRILIETGLTFLNKLLKFGLIYNLYIFKSNKKLKGNGYNNSIPNQIKRFKIKKKINVNLENDDFYKIKVK